MNHARVVVLAVAVAVDVGAATKELFNNNLPILPALLAILCVSRTDALE